MGFQAPRAAEVNAHLVGVPGGRAQMSTPSLVVDLTILKRNIAKMAEHCAANGIRLRPHTKTHKTAAIARLQIEAGAIGICCAKLAEAEAMTEAGVANIVLTSPVVSAASLKRLSRLNESAEGLIVVVDDLSMVEKLGEAAKASGKPLGVLVDLDVGTRRTGTPSIEDACAIAAAVAANGALNYQGIQAYAGHVQHIADPDERRTKSLAAMAHMAAVRDALTERNLRPTILTGGGTGSYDIDPSANVLTELQGGSYLFMDREYADVWTDAKQTPPFETSLAVQSTVISTSHTSHVTTDAGLKAFATDAGPPRLLSGAGPTANYFFFGDEQGGVGAKDPDDLPKRGDIVTCMVPHCDPTVNLYDVIHVVEGDTLVDIWPVTSRGRGY